MRLVGRRSQVALTREQLAALAGTSRETCAKVLRPASTACCTWPAGASPSSTPNSSRTPEADVTKP